jgi:predicted 3-demethylubiquinone-9 3-methyltransferase (glyoxalase superfamily)
MAARTSNSPKVSRSLSFWKDQGEVDEYWNKPGSAAATPSQCGWITDQFGITWQIVPRRFTELISDKNRKKVQAVMEAMMTMMTMVKLDVAALERMKLATLAFCLIRPQLN